MVNDRLLRAAEGASSVEEALDLVVEKYREIWNREIGQLTRLEWHLPVEEDRERFRELQEGLRELLEVAAEDLRSGVDPEELRDCVKS